MTFVTAGLAVAGACAVAIPIVIFLLWRQRRTPIEWAAMRFLLEAYRKHRRRLQVEQLLLLAIRCLILLLIGMALARPILEASGVLDRGGSRTVYFVIDDGLGSGVEEEPGEVALDRHVRRAAEIIDSLEIGDRVGLVTASRPARVALSPPSSDHRAVQDLLRSMKPTAAPTDIAGALARLGGILGQLDADHDNVFVYLLSEFRAGSAAIDETLPAALDGLGDRVVLLASPPETEPRANVQITGLEPARGLILPGAMDGSGQVTVRLARQGGELGRDVTRVRLAGEGIALAEPKLVEWTPGQSEASVEFVLDVATQGERETGLSAHIDDDALAADNERHTVLAVRKQIRVVLLDRRSFGFQPALDHLTAGQWILRALSPGRETTVDVVFVDPAALEEADLRTAEAAILPRPDLLAPAGWALARRFVDRGGLLIITPPAEMNVHRWADHLTSDLQLPWALERETIEYPVAVPLAAEQPPAPLLRMISGDLADLVRPIAVQRVLPPAEGHGAEDAALVLADGTPVLLVDRPRSGAAEREGAGPGGAEETGDAAAAGEPSAPSQGLVIYLAVAPELAWTNLPGKPLMVPLYHEMIRQGLSLIRASRPVNVGDRPPLLVGPAAAAVIAPGGESTPLDAGGRPERVLSAPGLYRVVDRAAQAVGEVAVNVEPAAGRTDPQSEAVVKAWLARSGPWSFLDPARPAAALGRAQGGSPLAGLLLLIALGLIVLETVLARAFSHAQLRRAGRASSGLRPSMADRGRGGGLDLGGAT